MAFVFDRKLAKRAIRSVMAAQGASEGVEDLEVALGMLSTKKIRKELEESWSVDLKAYKQQIDEIVMARCCQLRGEPKEEAPPVVLQKKRAAATPHTADGGGGGKKKARVNPASGRAAAAAPVGKTEAEEARLLALVKRCKLSRPRVLSKVTRLSCDRSVHDTLTHTCARALGPPQPARDLRPPDRWPDGRRGARGEATRNCCGSPRDAPARARRGDRVHRPEGARVRARRDRHEQHHRRARRLCQRPAAPRRRARFLRTEHDCCRWRERRQAACQEQWARSAR